MTTITAYGFATHEGAVRQVNEDNFCVMPDIGLFAVADGMGGHRGGRTASRITVENLACLVKKGNSLIRAIEEIHHDILRAAAADLELNGMGSTVVAMKTVNDHYEIVWVGDSRAYAWDGATLKRLTRDHSYVQYLLDEGAITARDMSDHPQRNIILQALGARDMEAVAPDLVSGVFHESEMILLCSDGLTTEVDDIRIAEILSRETSPQKAADLLVEAAISSGGSDNITVIIVAAPESAGAVSDPLADTEVFNIAEATIAVVDNEKTEIDEAPVFDPPSPSALADDDGKTQIDDAVTSPDKRPEAFAEDLEITRIEENGVFDSPDRRKGHQTEAGRPASTFKTACWVILALAALTALAIGLVYLP
jgi:PPM family protein phosphatase